MWMTTFSISLAFNKGRTYLSSMRSVIKIYVEVSGVTTVLYLKVAPFLCVHAHKSVWIAINNSVIFFGLLTQAQEHNVSSCLADLQSLRNLTTN